MGARRDERRRGAVVEGEQPRRLEHGGSWIGFRSHIARHPGIGLTIVILANRSDLQPSRYIDPIADIYLQTMEGR